MIGTPGRGYLSAEMRKDRKILADSITFFIGLDSCTAGALLRRLSLPLLTFPSNHQLLPLTTLCHHHGKGNVRPPNPAPSQLSSSTCRKYYDLLEVQPDASESDLKKAYRKK